jgi:hypothetical protein
MTDQLKDANSQDAQTAVRNKDSASVAQQPSSATVRTEVQVEDSRANCCYSNFCRVTGTPEELILDFGLNAQPMGATNVEIQQRLIVNYFTAKRLVQALAMSIQRHESAFGVLETDVQKRVTPSLRRANAPA